MPGVEPDGAVAILAGMSTDSEEAARAAQLRYVSDSRPGIRRRVAGAGFIYIDGQDARVEDDAVLTRIRGLAIPPAWTEVWICKLSHGHLQASGRDARGRKQYRYHARWRKVRDEAKYDRMLKFGAALPRIRECVEGHLRLTKLNRAEGSGDRDAPAGDHFHQDWQRGIRTHEQLLRTDDVEGPACQGHGGTIRFRFRGKSGKEHQITLANRRLARLVKSCQDLPGQDLFQYIDENGEPQPIDSGNVNAYLREIAGEDFTAKDFRTWAGTLLTAQLLDEYPGVESVTAAKAACGNAVKEVARQLGNTPAICRTCYIHPTILAGFLDPEKLALWKRTSAAANERAGLNRHEVALIRYLEAITG